MALPIRVAPKNVQKGTRKCPHVIPARSNSGLGICKTINQFIHPYSTKVDYSISELKQECLMMITLGYKRMHTIL